MSISIDDLVASLSSSAHIGQEATDLAALQKQLAQTIFAQPFPSYDTTRSSSNPLCNTPTMRSPCSSMSSSWSRERDAAFASLAQQRRRSSSIASARSHSSYSEKENRGGHQSFMEGEDDTMMMDEDEEQIVEELLGHSHSHLHSHPPSAYPSTSAHPQQHHPHPFHPFNANTSASAHAHPPSSFAHTDPFFAAAQAHASQPPSASFFAQAGRPAHDSPFFLPPAETLSVPHRRMDTRVTG